MELLSKTIKALGAPLSSSMPVPDRHQPLAMAYWRHGDGEIDIGGDESAPVVLHLSDKLRVERRRNGTWSTRPCGIGLVTVADPEAATRFAIRGQGDVLALFLPVTEIAKVTPGRHQSVRDRFLEADPEIERCALRALVALHDGDGSDPLLLSSIALRLSARLIDGPAEADRRVVGGLSLRQVHRVEALIASRIAESVAASPSLEVLAAEANLSPYHFAREFRRSVGMTPYAYTLRRRLELARALLVRSDMSLAEVGRRAGFPSPSHFTDRFRREMGVTPGALRRAVRG